MADDVKFCPSCGASTSDSSSENNATNTAYNFCIKEFL